MFKKFYISSITSILFITFIFSFSNSNLYNYTYPIKNNNSISSYYGIRQLYGKYGFHNGIDIPVIQETPINCISNGIVKYIGFDAYGYGNYIIILHSSSYMSLYGHLSENCIVSVGDRIIQGEVIAYVGPKILSNGKSNGNTTGSHLHFTVFSPEGKSLDPLSLKYNK